jgi:hypothetical protein
MFEFQYQSFKDSVVPPASYSELASLALPPSGLVLDLSTIPIINFWTETFILSNYLKTEGLCTTTNTVLTELRPPGPSQSVYREDCTQCFDSIVCPKN